MNNKKQNEEARLVFSCDNGQNGAFYASVMITRKDSRYFVTLRGGKATRWFNPKSFELSASDAAKIVDANTFEQVLLTLLELEEEKEEKKQ